MNGRDAFQDPQQFTPRRGPCSVSDWLALSWGVCTRLAGAELGASAPDCLVPRGRPLNRPVRGWGRPRWTLALAPGALTPLLPGDTLPVPKALPQEPCPDRRRPPTKPVPEVFPRPAAAAPVLLPLGRCFPVCPRVSRELESTSRAGTIIKPLCVP